MKCTVICTGSLKEKYWKEAEKEYAKRMGRFGGWSVIELPECSLPERPGPKEIETALEKEAEQIFKKIPNRAYPIALCVEGNPLSSEELAGMVAKLPAEGFSEIALIIGSSHGLSPRIKQFCKRRLSVSPMTFPHQMMRVILAEQFYRAHKIIAGESYHK